MRIAGGTAKRITKRIINFILVIWGVVTLSFCLNIETMRPHFRSPIDFFGFP